MAANLAKSGGTLKTIMKRGGSDGGLPYIVGDSVRHDLLLTSDGVEQYNIFYVCMDKMRAVLTIRVRFRRLSEAG